MKKPIGCVKMRNLFKGRGYITSIHNVRINGVLQGCSGYIKNPQTGKTVYINAEEQIYQPLQNKIMFRIADDINDDGDHLSFEHKNQWPDKDEFVDAVCAELDSVKPVIRY